MAAYLFVWGLFTVVLFVATLKMNRAIMVVFFALTILFFLLAIADATGERALQRVAGYEGILCGLGAIYVGAAQILNEVWGRTVLPIGTIEARRTARRTSRTRAPSAQNRGPESTSVRCRRAVRLARAKSRFAVRLNELPSQNAYPTPTVRSPPRALSVGLPEPRLARRVENAARPEAAAQEEPGPASGRT